MKRKIAIFGPHDRYNYGDILFPIMLKFALNKLNPESYIFKNYSLVEADFTKKGGYLSQSYRMLTKEIETGDVDSLIVAGGECLRANWNGLFSFINPFYFRIFRHPRIPVFFKKDIYIQKYLGGKSENPFLINKSDFKTDFKIIYNSVGGGKNIEDRKVERLENCNYLSFRENPSKTYVEERITNKTVYLVPDSAIILDDVYPRNSLLKNKRVSQLISKIIKEEKYVYFQVSKYKNENKLAEIAHQLSEIAKINKVKIVLCAIGTAKGHEDYEPLIKIHKKIQDIGYLFTNPNIEEIIALISYSKLYIGNSLHGIITAMSYGVPYIGLNKNQIKVNYYLGTWAIPALSNTANVDGFLELASETLQNPLIVDEILIKTKEQKEIYYKSIQRISEIIEQ